MISDITIDLFLNELESRQVELIDECTTDNVEKESFARACIEILCDSGMLIDEPEIVLIDENGFSVDAICWPDPDQPIVEFLLFVIGKKSEEEVTTEIISTFNKTTAILRSLGRPTRRAVPESVNRLIGRIYNLAPSPESILVRIITSSKISIPNLQKKLSTKLKNTLPSEIHTDVRLCDVETLCISRDGAVQGPTIEFDAGQVKCFLAHEMIDHDVYLAAFPGNILAKLFREYGQRLLQKNVRAFLGLKGKRNKKIQETILQHPERFLAYNNGLTITVSGVQLDERNSLQRIDNAQIVNGGQTIAILSNEFRTNSPECLSSVIVAAKLIHVKNTEQHMEWIERIAETSNTQNAIKDADLSSHNPIYRKIKELSSQAVFRKGVREYKWYFSRVRKEYEAEYQENKKRGHISLKKFEDTFPRDFSIDKSVVARVETVFDARPWISSRGEAKYQADFLDRIRDGFEPDMNWYRTLIGKFIFVKHMTNIARKVGIGEGRSCIVEYACAILSFSKNFPDLLEKIHQTQEVPASLEGKIGDILLKTHSIFVSLGTDRSIKEHAKREEVWGKILSEAKLNGWANAW